MTGTDPPHFDEAFRARFLDLLRWRRDVRRFRPDPLPPGTLERLIALACLAPSVGLSQPWRFVVVDSPERRQAVRASFERCNAAAAEAEPDGRAALYRSLKLAGIDEAPCQFAVFAEPDPARGHGLGRRTMAATVGYSAAMAIHTIWLAARAEGLGLGWVSILDPAEVAAILDVPPDWTFIGYLCLGTPQEEGEVPALEKAGWETRTGPSALVLQR